MLKGKELEKNIDLNKSLDKRIVNEECVGDLNEL